MTRASTRVRIDAGGALEVIDPGFDSVPLLEHVDPDFRIQRAPLPGFVAPRLLSTRAACSGVSGATLGTLSEAELWAVHGRVRSEVRRHENDWALCRDGESSLMDVKVELAWRLLTDCRLCGQRCGVDRTAGQTGICGLGPKAVVAEHFVHIAEEPPINPSLVLNLAGCGLRCRYCQQGDLLAVRSVTGESLAPELWNSLDWNGARSMSFVGGNPDESLFAILRFLRAAPGDWRLPIVWNCHAYGTTEVLHLLDGIVDAFAPDLKYGRDECGEHLSGASGYVRISRETVSAMLVQEVPVIVRVLVLPGHLTCCHVPALAALADIASERLLVSVRGQYSPDHHITSDDGPLAHRVGGDEVEAVRRHAREIGLHVVS